MVNWRDFLIERTGCRWYTIKLSGQPAQYCNGPLMIYIIDHTMTIVERYWATDLNQYRYLYLGDPDFFDRLEAILLELAKVGKLTRRGAIVCDN